jgi:tellurite methyltransferase
MTSGSTSSGAGRILRQISGFHQDDEGDWVAELECGHNQHVRHRPPFQPRPWVLERSEREARIGTPLECPLCERAELPPDLRHVRTSPEWDDNTMPAGLKRRHRLAAGTWGQVSVHTGQLRLLIPGEPGIDVVLGPGSTQAIPPEVEHEATPQGPVRFSIDFFAVDPRRDPCDEGGDPACWAGLLCPECGAVRGGAHRPGCPVSGDDQPTTTPGF